MRITNQENKIEKLEQNKTNKKRLVGENCVINLYKLAVDQASHGSKSGFRSWQLRSLLDQVSKQKCLSLTSPVLVYSYLSELGVSHEEPNLLFVLKSNYK